MHITTLGCIWRYCISALWSTILYALKLLRRQKINNHDHCLTAGFPAILEGQGHCCLAVPANAWTAMLASIGSTFQFQLFPHTWHQYQWAPFQGPESQFSERSSSGLLMHKFHLQSAHPQRFGFLLPVVCPVNFWGTNPARAAPSHYRSESQLWGDPPPGF